MIVRLHAGLANVGVDFGLAEGKHCLSGGEDRESRVFHLFWEGGRSMGKMTFAFAETQIISLIFLPYFYCLSGIAGAGAQHIPRLSAPGGCDFENRVVGWSYVSNSPYTVLS